MAEINFKNAFEKKLQEKVRDYSVCGVVSKDGTVYPLGSDTKVLSTIFELFTRPLIKEIAQEHQLTMLEPDVQNHYPDFTLLTGPEDMNKIAIDVKTTYIDLETDSFGFTLGGYTSFIRGNGTKNIVFPFNSYSEHWVIGYVYTRVAKKAGEHKTYNTNELDQISLPYKDVKVFVREKWEIASDRAGSGNTTNIGSIIGKIEDFRVGKAIFRSEDEFLDYWRNYERTAETRVGKFKNITEFRAWKKNQAA